MEADKLKILLGKYYSGDIMPDEYQSLLATLKEADKLTPELEDERRMLLAIESCGPSEPKGLESRLIMAIDNRSKSRKIFFRMVCSGSVAAIVLMIVAIGVHFHHNNTINLSQTIANVSVEHETVVTQESQETREMEAPDNTMQAVSVAHNNLIPHSISEEELEKSVQVADEALMEILANVQMAKNEVIETIDNIEISQTMDYNIL